MTEMGGGSAQSAAACCSQRARSVEQPRPDRRSPVTVATTASVNPLPGLPPNCTADLNDDGTVDGGDPAAARNRIARTACVGYINHDTTRISRSCSASGTREGAHTDRGCDTGATKAPLCSSDVMERRSARSTERIRRGRMPALVPPRNARTHRGDGRSSLAYRGGGPRRDVKSTRRSSRAARSTARYRRRTEGARRCRRGTGCEFDLLARRRHQRRTLRCSRRTESIAGFPLHVIAGDPPRKLLGMVRTDDPDHGWPRRANNPRLYASCRRSSRALLELELAHERA